MNERSHRSKFGDFFFRESATVNRETANGKRESRPQNFRNSFLYSIITLANYHISTLVFFSSV
jgi:hypothetical protein